MRSSWSQSLHVRSVWARFKRTSLYWPIPFYVGGAIANGVMFGLHERTPNMIAAAVLVFQSGIYLIAARLLELNRARREEERLQELRAPRLFREGWVLQSSSSVVSQPVWISAQASQRSPYEVAHERARSLFLRFLTDSERKELEAYGYITIRGSNGKKYTLSPNRDYNVREKGGKYRYCAIPWLNYSSAGQGEPLPIYDQLLAQKLLLENDADHFLRIAHKTYAV